MNLYLHDIDMGGIFRSKKEALLPLAVRGLYKGASIDLRESLSM
jgi:hypothetical protein